MNRAHSPTSDFKTSRHYLVGLPQTHLPASAREGTCGQATGGNLPQAGFSTVRGVAAGLGTMNPDTPIVIGKREGWGDARPFGISAADHCHHVYIIGKTGSGKTTLLRNMLIQHIALARVPPNSLKAKPVQMNG